MEQLQPTFSKLVEYIGMLQNEFFVQYGVTAAGVCYTLDEESVPMETFIQHGIASTICYSRIEESAHHKVRNLSMPEDPVFLISTLGFLESVTELRSECEDNGDDFNKELDYISRCLLLAQFASVHFTCRDFIRMQSRYIDSRTCFPIASISLRVEVTSGNCVLFKIMRCGWRNFQTTMRLTSIGCRDS